MEFLKDYYKNIKITEIDNDNFFKGNNIIYYIGYKMNIIKNINIIININHIIDSNYSENSFFGFKKNKINYINNIINNIIDFVHYIYTNDIDSELLKNIYYTINYIINNINKLKNPNIYNLIKILYLILIIELSKNNDDTLFINLFGINILQLSNICKLFNDSIINNKDKEIIEFYKNTPFNKLKTINNLIKKILSIYKKMYNNDDDIMYIDNFIYNVSDITIPNFKIIKILKLFGLGENEIYNINLEFFINENNNINLLFNISLIPPINFMNVGNNKIHNGYYKLIINKIINYNNSFNYFSIYNNLNNMKYINIFTININNDLKIENSIYNLVYIFNYNVYYYNRVIHKYNSLIPDCNVNLKKKLFNIYDNRLYFINELFYEDLDSKYDVIKNNFLDYYKDDNNKEYNIISKIIETKSLNIKEEFKLPSFIDFI